MSKLTDIKYKIDQLDGGSFQNLCDAYLAHIGYKNIYSLGMKSGTDKTTKGNPDTYFLNADGKYIFVMYTTQKKNFINKAIEDIEKCFDPSKTGVPSSDVVEIIYCHTYGRLIPGDDKKLRSYCKTNNTLLTLKGLDEISTDIYLKHHSIAKDFLNISLDTDQILDSKSFVTSHDANKISAPLNTEFMFRAVEIKNTILQLNEHNVLVISGPAGVGKTRFALEICDMYASQNEYKVFCIRSNHLEIYEDLKDIFESNKKYILMIDDANELNKLQDALNYLTKNSEQFSIKIVITVRDYVKKGILEDVLEFEEPAILKLFPLSDDEIHQMMEKIYNITNHLYTDRIIRIAEGNARLAILAGKIASEKKNLNAIRNASDLYDNYYSKQIKVILSSNPTNIISAGIIAFLQTIRLDYLDRIKDIFDVAGVKETQFIADIKQLRDLELVDLYDDKIAKISDQSFENFLIKYVFVDQKLIPLHLIIEIYFEINKTRTVIACNTLLNVFSDTTVQEYLKQEINLVWDKLKSNQERFLPFLKAFHMIRPTETLCIIQEQIESEISKNFDVRSIDFKETSKLRQIDDEIINVLGDFSKEKSLFEAIELLFTYYKKRPDLFMQFYWVFIERYGFSEDSNLIQYYTQKTVLKRFFYYIKMDPSDENILLFIHVAEYYLKLFYSPIEEERNDKIIIYKIPLIYSDIIMMYRNSLWNELLNIYENGKFTDIIENLLYNYGNEYEEKIDYRIVQEEYESILRFFEKELSSDNLYHCIIAEHIKEVGIHSGVSDFKKLADFLDSAKYHIYHTLTNEFTELGIEYKEVEKKRKKEISKLVAHYSENEIEFMLQVCRESVVNIPDNPHLLSEGLAYVYEEFSKNPKVFIKAVKLYLKYETPCDALYPNYIVKILFKMISCSEVEKIIFAYEYVQKNEWLWAFYTELPQEEITEEYKDNLLDYLAKPPLTLHSARYRSIDLIEKYSYIDEDILLNASRIIVDHYDEAPFVFNLYFSLLFNEYSHSADEIITKYEKDLTLLWNIYIKNITCNEQEDSDGVFLMHLIEIDDQFLIKYLDYIFLQDSNTFYNESEIYTKRLYKIWDNSNYMKYMDQILSYFHKETSVNKSKLQNVIRFLLINEQKNSISTINQNKWIKKVIDLYNLNTEFICSIFKIISEWTPDRKKEMIIYLINLNPNPELFLKLPLETSLCGGMGSIIPCMEERIEFLSSLLPYLSGSKYLKHKQRIENNIEEWKVRIKDEKRNEILRF